MMAKIGDVLQVSIEDLRPYANNAKVHGEEQVERIADSIREFGFLNPVLIDEEKNVIAGHGRIMAAKKLGLKRIPCVYVEGLTEAQRKAYILADNRLAELAEWDMEAVTLELEELRDMDFNVDLTGFDYEEEEGWFESRKRYDNDIENETDEYRDFVEKFEKKRTTDDCYTPDNIYDAVASWVEKEYGLQRENFVRPFYPNGDYQKEKYKPTDIVVDNPPFSILAQICRWYVEHGIRFFLFAPTLTLFTADMEEVCNICAGIDITYENGAYVNTSFKTNLEKGYVIRTAPELTAELKRIDAINKGSDRILPKYEYPANIVTSARIAGWSEVGVDFKVPRAAALKITELDAMKAQGRGIFGGAYLVSDLCAEKATQAGKDAKIRRAAMAVQAAQDQKEKMIARAKEAAGTAGFTEADLNENGEIVWKLSEREKTVVEELNKKGQ